MKSLSREDSRKLRRKILKFLAKSNGDVNGWKRLDWAEAGEWSERIAKSLMQLGLIELRYSTSPGNYLEARITQTGRTASANDWLTRKELEISLKVTTDVVDVWERMARELGVTWKTGRGYEEGRGSITALMRFITIYESEFKRWFKAMSGETQ